MKSWENNASYNRLKARFLAAVTLAAADGFASPLTFFMSGLPHLSALLSFTGLAHGVQLPMPCLVPSGMGLLLGTAWI
jgi:hypothetical protein